MFRSDSSLTLGRILGVPVRLAPGAALLAGALTIMLGSRWVREGAGSDAYLFAAVAAAGFLASILVHELSHAAMARRYGVAVSEIRLVLLGGLARLERQAPSPRAEMAIAAVGPASSGAVAVAGLVRVRGLRAQDVSQAAVSAVLWIAVINAILGVFNLLPGLPLDGGRVLTGWLWSRSGDRARAVNVAAKVGRILGIGLVVLGVAEIVITRSFLGLWTVVVGNLLISAARAEAGHAQLVRSVRGFTVGQAMDPRPATVELGTRSIVARALLPAPDRVRWAVAVDEGGVARGLVDVLALDRLADARPDELIDQFLLEVDDRRAAYPGEALDAVLARVQGLPVVVIDDKWRPVGVLSDVRVQATPPSA